MKQTFHGKRFGLSLLLTDIAIFSGIAIDFTFNFEGFSLRISRLLRHRNCA
jgi:hypothetical protein